MKFTKNFGHGRRCGCDECLHAERELAAAFDRERFDLLPSVTGLPVETGFHGEWESAWRPSDRSEP